MSLRCMMVNHVTMPLRYSTPETRFLREDATYIRLPPPTFTMATHCPNAPSKTANARTATALGLAIAQKVFLSHLEQVSVTSEATCTLCTNQTRRFSAVSVGDEGVGGRE